MIYKVNTCFLFFFILSVFYSCQLKNRQASENTIDSTMVTVGELSMTGIVEDASMNNFMLITLTGDTVWVSTMDQDPREVGGFSLGDTVKVNYIQEEAEPGTNTIPTAKKVIIIGKKHNTEE